MTNFDRFLEQRVIVIECIPDQVMRSILNSSEDDPDYYDNYSKVAGYFIEPEYTDESYRFDDIDMEDPEIREWTDSLCGGSFESTIMRLPCLFTPTCLEFIRLVGELGY